MTILCTFPGKYGDLIWALPTIRAISRRIGEPVDLEIAAPFASICPVLEQQPYLGQVVANAQWRTEDTAPISPRIPPQVLGAGYDLTLHLGYRSWPLPDVLRHTLCTAHEELHTKSATLAWMTGTGLTVDELQLTDPWITLPDPRPNRTARYGVCCGFTDEHFELKYGITQLLKARGVHVRQAGDNPRWRAEGYWSYSGWEQTVRVMRDAQVFLGCNSALHVLAVAVGLPVVLMEPNPHRHNAVFYPLGQTGPQVTLVTGTDGLPTFDARHVYDALKGHL